VGEVVLAALLLVALAAAPRDAIPSASSDDSIGPTARYQVTPQEQPSLGLTLPSLRGIAESVKAGGQAVRLQALIPTAPPVRLIIPSQRVSRPVEPVGLGRHGVMNLPVNGWNAGWYSAGPVPGAPGDAVIEGHAGYPNELMFFGKLTMLPRGAQIVVVLADGTQRLFEVVSMSIVPAGTSPPGLADASGEPRLTLVTCGGHFDADNKYYTQRLMVEARYVGPV
jgi:LPXTG-site transpeptidase (sortase) family protein